MTQHEAIIDYLQSGNSLTGLEALRLFGTMKLASRISEIRRKKPTLEFHITTITTDTGKRVAQYRLKTLDEICEVGK